MRKKLFALLLLFAVLPLLRAQDVVPPPHLKDYVSKDDGVFTWKLVEIKDSEGNSIAKLKMESQKWQGGVWKHDIDVFLPKGVKPTGTVILMNDGGTSNAGRTAIGLALAQRANAPVVMLYGIPNQPLYGKREDALIAETFVKFLETKDTTWPLLFPMVKSVVKCMDAVQAFAKEHWKFDVTGFVVTGASKRGWTTWLTAATGDKRVKGIAPLVFDSLNMLEQMPLQIKSFGDFSLMIHDYKERGLLPPPEGPDAKLLWAMVDPWVYREAITIPKLIINGANDPYWTLEATSLYWKGLKGTNSLLSVPNSGHDLRPMDDPGAAKPVKDILPMKAIDTLAAFSKSVIEGKVFPVLDAKAEGDKMCVSFNVVPTYYRIWTASSETRDFRRSKWTASESKTLSFGEKAYYSIVSDKPFNADFLEAEYEVGSTKYYLSTPARIVEKK